MRGRWSTGTSARHGNGRGASQVWRRNDPRSNPKRPRHAVRRSPYSQCHAVSVIQSDARAPGQPPVNGRCSTCGLDGELAPPRSFTDTLTAYLSAEVPRSVKRRRTCEHGSGVDGRRHEEKKRHGEPTLKSIALLITITQHASRHAHARTSTSRPSRGSWAGGSAAAWLRRKTSQRTPTPAVPSPPHRPHCRR